MRSFSCPACGQLLFFENSTCLNCGTALGYARRSRDLVELGGLVRCANAGIAACNWLVAPGEGLCGSCVLTRTRPADSDEPGMQAFVRAEAAKRRLVHQLDDLGLPTSGVVFDLLSGGPVITGHADGVVTIDLAEGDDGHREALRVQLAEPYRTLLGHLRHETGHWYWTVLVEPAPEPFRALFGDERADYAAALDRHYAAHPAAGWEDTHVSAYATAHPWEDWAESFAHYLHIRDTLQTAAAFGLAVPDAVPIKDDTGFDDLIATWLPLTYALNAVNRSMGKDDLYPFVLSERVLEKLRFVHTLVTAP
ncbi:MAG: putative zinc-binding metallopeptidase [Pseudonocardia sp.]|nr:putative zinc-binding metallopeptidase [Pseudonocardia sp.]